MQTVDLMDKAFDDAAPAQAADWRPEQAVQAAAGQDKETPLTPQDVEAILIYLARTRDKAEQIRERAPAGSYLDKVLMNTIDGIAREMAQLKYLLAHPDVPVPVHLTNEFRPNRMRPAL